MGLLTVMGSEGCHDVIYDVRAWRVHSKVYFKTEDIQQNSKVKNMYEK